MFYGSGLVGSLWRTSAFMQSFINPIRVDILALDYEF